MATNYNQQTPETLESSPKSLYFPKLFPCLLEPSTLLLNHCFIFPCQITAIWVCSIRWENSNSIRYQNEINLPDKYTSQWHHISCYLRKHMQWEHQPAEYNVKWESQIISIYITWYKWIFNCACSQTTFLLLHIPSAIIQKGRVVKIAQPIHLHLLLDENLCSLSKQNAQNFKISIIFPFGRTNSGTTVISWILTLVNKWWLIKEMSGGNIKNLAPSCLGFWFLGMHPEMKVATPFASYSPWFSKRVITFSLWMCKPRGKETTLSILVNQSHYKPG